MNQFTKEKGNVMLFFIEQRARTRQRIEDLSPWGPQTTSLIILASSPFFFSLQVFESNVGNCFPHLFKHSEHLFENVKLQSAKAIPQQVQEPIREVQEAIASNVNYIAQSRARRATKNRMRQARPAANPQVDKTIFNFFFKNMF